MARRRRKTEPRRRETTVHDLPDECLALVFPFLGSRADRDAASLTCRRWRALDALSRPSLYLSCTEREEWRHLYHYALHALKVFPNILSLSVDFHKKLPPLFFSFFPSKALAQLQSVSFYGNHTSGINDAFVKCVAGCCPALRHLGISMCRVTDVGLCGLAQGCRHLVSLDASLCRVTDEGIDMLLTMCPKMEVLDVSEVYGISGWGFRHGKSLRRLEANFIDDNVSEALKVATCSNARDPDSATVIEALGEGCPTLAVLGMCCKLLVELHLSWSALNDYSLQAIAQGCSDLKVLEVRFCRNITFMGWQAVTLSCLKLEHLNIHGCDQSHVGSLLALQRGCPSLTHLQISQDLLPPNLVVKLFHVSRQSMVHITIYDEKGGCIVST